MRIVLRECDVCLNSNLILKYFRSCKLNAPALFQPHITCNTSVYNRLLLAP